MSSGGRRPLRPGMVPGGGVGQGWVPGVNMPPLGFGLVAQQPHLAHQQPLSQAWHQQQFMASQVNLGGGPMGVQNMTQPQQQQAQHFQQPQHQQYQHPFQQQWMEAQRKAAEEQRKMYEQMMKQRQFDEQKMRLKAFSASSKKAEVSADTMIELILGGKEQNKPKSPLPLKKDGGGEGQQATTTTQLQPQKQGTAVDWTKLENMDSLFSSPKKTSPAAATEQRADMTQPPTEAPLPGAKEATTHLPADTSRPPTGAQGYIGTTQDGMNKGRRKDGKSPVLLPPWLKDHNSLPAIYQQAGSLVGGPEGWVDTSRAYMLLMKTGLPPPLLGVLWEMVNCTTPGQLTQDEFTALLALIALVQSGQPIANPEVLSAVTEPVLPIIDHPALIPLVQEYIQKKQQQQLQQQGPQEAKTPAQTNSDDDEFNDFVSVGNPGVTTVPPTPSSFYPNASGGCQNQIQTPTPWPAVAGTQVPTKALTQANEKNKTMNLPKLGFSPEPSPATSFDQTGDDDFDDFQSASAPCIPQSAAAPCIPQSGKPGVLGDGISNKNLAAPCIPQSANPGCSGDSALNKNSSTETALAFPVLLQPEKPGGESDDKYAVFREIESRTEPGSDPASDARVPEGADESFGEFCSSEVASLSLTQTTTFPSLPSHSANNTNNTSPVSFEVYSTPPEALPENQADNFFEADFGKAFTSSTQPTSNYADLHEAMKKAEAEQRRKEASEWSDPFGEFEEAPSATVAAASAGTLPSLASSSVPWLSVGMSDKEEDFGDFMGPDGGAGDVGGGLGGNLSIPGHSETLGETQSVASLELPGLEVTVGVDQSDVFGPGASNSPDLFLHPRSEINSLEDHLSGLSLETTVGGNQTGTGVTSTAQVTATTASVMDSYCGGGLVDKYSIIREEASRESHGEAHTGSWERCLENSVKVLQEAQSILAGITAPSLKSQVLATSQMQDYLANVQEVWLVCGRIAVSSQHVTTSCRVDQLLSQARTLWEEILAAAENTISKVNAADDGDNQMGEGEVCGVCLTGGGSRLTYGGHSYHPPCANLWLNCVDLLLPSLTPVTLL